MTTARTPGEPRQSTTDSAALSSQAIGTSPPVRRFSSEAVNLYQVWFGTSLAELDDAEALRRSRNRRALLKEVDRLAVAMEDWRVLAMREDGASLEEIGVILGVKSSAVENRLARVRKRKRS